MADFNLPISPAVEALRKAAAPRSAHSSHHLPGAEGRLTPLELDANLQVSELMYRNLLLGKQVQVDFDTGTDGWYREIFGEEWAKKNLFQRRELERQAKESGENTPMWVEAAAGSADLASEVLQFGPTGGECLRRARADREFVKELLESLLLKVRISHYARCGAGEKQNGLRAMVGVLWQFYADAEIVSLCAECLRTVITDNQYNCDSLLAIWTPVYPEESHHGQVERGWSFLRIALDAFVFQAGGEIHPREDLATTVSRDSEAALQLAQCVLAASASRILEAQLQMKEQRHREQKELKEILPKVLRTASELSGKMKGNSVLKELIHLLE